MCILVCYSFALLFFYSVLLIHWLGGVTIPKDTISFFSFYLTTCKELIIENIGAHEGQILTSCEKGMIFPSLLLFHALFLVVSFFLWCLLSMHLMCSSSCICKQQKDQASLRQLKFFFIFSFFLQGIKGVNSPSSSPFF